MLISRSSLMGQLVVKSFITAMMNDRLSKASRTHSVLTWVNKITYKDLPGGSREPLGIRHPSADDLLGAVQALRSLA